MSKTKWYIEQTVDLSSLGKEWDECYLKFTPFTISEAKGFVKFKGKEERAGIELMDKLKEHFISGVVFNGKEKEEIKEDALEDMPITVYNMVIEELIVGVEKKMMQESKPSRT